MLQEFWNLDPLEPNSWGKHFDLVFIVCSSALLVFAFNFRPVIIEVPHFASLRGKEREIVILRSDNGETWREHTLEATEEAVQEVLQESFDPDGKNCHEKVTIFNKTTTYFCITELSQLEDLNTNRITRILTTDFPQYFAIVSRIRQEVHAIGPEGK